MGANLLSEPVEISLAEMRALIDLVTGHNWDPDSLMEFELLEVQDDGALVVSVGDPPTIHKVNCIGGSAPHRMPGRNA